MIVYKSHEVESLYPEGEGKLYYMRYNYIQNERHKTYPMGGGPGGGPYLRLLVSEGG